MNREKEYRAALIRAAKVFYVSSARLENIHKLLADELHQEALGLTELLQLGAEKEEKEIQ